MAQYALYFTELSAGLARQALQKKPQTCGLHASATNKLSQWQQTCQEAESSPQGIGVVNVIQKHTPFALVHAGACESVHQLPSQVGQQGERQHQQKDQHDLGGPVGRHNVTWQAKQETDRHNTVSTDGVSQLRYIDTRSLSASLWCSKLCTAASAWHPFCDVCPALTSSLMCTLATACYRPQWLV